MLKINLLPPSYVGRNKIVLAWVVVAAAIAIEVAALVFLSFPMKQRETELQAKVQRDQQAQQQVQQLKSEADGTRGGAAVYDKPIGEAKSLKAFNVQRPNLYQHATRYIYDNVMVTSMESTANQLKLSLYVSNIGDLSRTFLYLHNSPDFMPNGIQLAGVPEFRKPIRLAL